MSMPKMPGVAVTQEFSNPDRFPSDEAIEAHNAGRLQQFVAKYIRKQMQKFVGRPNTDELRGATRTVLVQTVRQLESMGIIDPNEHDVDVREDTWADRQACGDLGPPDPTLVHVSIKNKKRQPEPKKEEPTSGYKTHEESNMTKDELLVRIASDTGIHISRLLIERCNKRFTLSVDVLNGTEDERWAAAAVLHKYRPAATEAHVSAPRDYTNCSLCGTRLKVVELTRKGKVQAKSRCANHLCKNSHHWMPSYRPASTQPSSPPMAFAVDHGYDEPADPPKPAETLTELLCGTQPLSAPWQPQVNQWIRHRKTYRGGCINYKTETLMSETWSVRFTDMEYPVDLTTEELVTNYEPEPVSAIMNPPAPKPLEPAALKPLIARERELLRKQQMEKIHELWEQGKVSSEYMKQQALCDDLALMQQEIVRGMQVPEKYLKANYSSSSFADAYFKKCSELDLESLSRTLKETAKKYGINIFTAKAAAREGDTVRVARPSLGEERLPLPEKLGDEHVGMIIYARHSGARWLLMNRTPDKRWPVVSTDGRYTTAEYTEAELRQCYYLKGTGRVSSSHPNQAMPPQEEYDEVVISGLNQNDELVDEVVRVPKGGGTVVTKNSYKTYSLTPQSSGCIYGGKLTVGVDKAKGKDMTAFTRWLLKDPKQG